MTATRYAAAILLALAGGSGCASSPTRAPAPDYLIAFNVLVDEDADDYEVFVMRLDGSGQTNVSNNERVDWVYSVHGNRLYAVSDRDDEKRKLHLYEVEEIDGAWQWRQITGFRVEDSYVGVRAEGEQLAVAADENGQRDVFLIDRSGQKLRALTHDEAFDRDPAFSPDGGTMVWSSKRTGIDELWTLDLESNETRQLTHYPEDDASTSTHAYHAGPPTWEPNQNLISYCSRRLGNDSIFTIRPDGTDERQITSDEFDDCYHAWSPDGRYLAYSGTNEHGHYDIYLRDTRTGKTIQLTHGPRTEQAPVFFVPHPSLGHAAK